MIPGLGSLALLGAVTAPDALVFAVSTVIILGGALGVVLLRRPVHEALCLVATLFGVAVLFLAQRADFLAAVQVIVYGGAIVVLFLFVIMLLGVDDEENLDKDPLPHQRLLALLAGMAVLGTILALAHSQWATGAHSVTRAVSGSEPDVSNIAKSVFTVYLLPFEATSALLVIAVVGAVMLARRRSPVPAGTTASAGPAEGPSSEESHSVSLDEEGQR